MTGLRPLYDHQARALDGLRASLMAGKTRPLLQAPTGFGKCLGIGTPVLLFDGRIVPVEDVAAGDLLMGPDSLPRQVLTTCRGSGELFRIVPHRGEPWVCNDVHVLTLVETVSGRVIDIPLDEYQRQSKTFKNCHKLFQPVDGVDFPNVADPEIDAYWLGLWVGDGSKALRGVAVSKPDAEVLVACEAVAERRGMAVRTDGQKYGKCPTHHLVTPRGQPNALLQDMRAIFGRNCERFPSEVVTASRMYRQEVLAGVIDSDGYVSNGCVEIVQKRGTLADAVAFIARSLGLKVVSTTKTVGGTDYRRMVLSGDFSGILPRISRKWIAPRRQVKVATRTGFRVEPIGVGEYAGFELDGDGRFLLGDFTVTHNTVVAAHIVSGIQRHGKRVCFCVPALGLIDQTFERFVENGISPDDMGVIQGDHHWRRPSAPIQIATAQTLARRELPDVDYVVVDEAHIRYEIIPKWMAEKPDVKFIGLSATPWSKGLGKQFDDLIKPVSLSWLIEHGYLSKFRVFAPSKPDLDGVRTVKGDWHEGDLEERMNKPALVADIVQTWLERGERRPTLCFAVNRRHAKALHDQFAECGVPSEYVDANTPRDEREAIGKRLASGDVQVVVNIGTLTTGIDWDVRCLILARPTKSESLFCLDSETEILTSHGWKGMGQIKEGDCVAATKDGVGCWSRVVATVERDMTPDESWIEYDAPRANFRVTDHHRMLFRSRNETAYRMAEAKEMLAVKGGCYVPTAVTVEQPGVPLTDAELYFIGMMMTDGTWTPTRGAISQSERHPEILMRIETCLRDCGIGYSKSREKVHASVGAMAVQERHPRWRYSLSAGKPKAHGNTGRGPVATKRTWQEVSGKTGYRHLLPYLDKDLAPALMALSKSQFTVLLCGIFDGDGSKRVNVDYTPRSMEICSARRLVVDRLQALAAIHGMTANVRSDQGPSRKQPIYFITITDKDWRSCGGYSSTGRNGGIARNLRPAIVQKSATAERVWCVQSEAGTIVTRRRGKVTVMGNCQIIGRALRTAPGKDDAIILDHSDTHMRLGMVTDIDFDELDMGRKDKASERKTKEKSALLPKCCPSCAALMPVLAKSCMSCGYTMPILPGIHEIDGELVEMGREGKPTGRVIDMLARMPRRSVYAQLNHIRWQTGKKKGWVAHKYRTIFGNWPSNSFGELETEDPTSEVRAWVRSENIRWVKSRQSKSGAGDIHAD